MKRERWLLARGLAAAAGDTGAREDIILRFDDLICEVEAVREILADPETCDGLPIRAVAEAIESFGIP